MLRSRNRRSVTIALAAALVGAATPASSATGEFRIGTTPVFLDDQVGLINEWRRYLISAMGLEVSFVQRRSYQEITDLLANEQLEAAWICGFPYVLNRARLDLCAVPIYHGQPLYRSYVIVPANDRATQSIHDLKGTVYAFSDPQSNSGYLVPYAQLVEDGSSPSTFFKRTFFTFGHRKVVEAVAVGLAQGGSVDGYVWDTLSLQMPAAVRGVRVAWRSPLYGFPPIVTRRSLSPVQADAFRSALLNMNDSDVGQHVLRRLNLDHFDAGSPSVFASIADLVRTAGLERS